MLFSLVVLDKMIIYVSQSQQLLLHFLKSHWFKFLGLDFLLFKLTKGIVGQSN